MTKYLDDQYENNISYKSNLLCKPICFPNYHIILWNIQTYVDIICYWQQSKLKYLSFLCCTDFVTNLSVHYFCAVPTSNLLHRKLLINCNILFQFIAFLISTPYTGLTVDQAGIQNMQGCLYLIVVETIFTFTYSVFHTFPSEIPVLLREIGNGLYSPGPYYISKMIVLVSSNNNNYL